MMSVRCDEIQRIINVWEREGSVSPFDCRAVREHFEECPVCAERYGALQPFLQRDGTLRSLFEEPEDHRSGMFADRVLFRIERKSGRMRPLPSRALYRTLAAAAVLAAGILGSAFLLLPRMGRAPMDDTIVEVHFSLTAPEAERVTLVGDFTDWEASRYELADPDGDGVWEARVPLRKDRVYEYNFIIDGEMWISDPGAIMQVNDGFGGESSLLSL